MSNKSEKLKELVEMSNWLGNSVNEYVILGEGNTSCKVDNETFYVKSSGSNLRTIKDDQFIEIQFDKILSLLDIDDATNDEINKIYKESMVDQSVSLKPSVETLFHAICLSFDEINFIAHTHPTSINILTCSKSYPDNLKGRMYPDEVVTLGNDSVFLPYIDPGVQLAKQIKIEIEAYIKKYNTLPKIIYIQNHGMIALGTTSTEAKNISETAVKAAKIRIGAIASSGISLLTEEMIDHLSKRPDERYRQELLK